MRARNVFTYRIISVFGVRLHVTEALELYFDDINVPWSAQSLAVRTSSPR
jgi:hypothetical protein